MKLARAPPALPSNPSASMADDHSLPLAPPTFTNPLPPQRRPVPQTPLSNSDFRKARALDARCWRARAAAERHDVPPARSTCSSQAAIFASTLLTLTRLRRQHCAAAQHAAAGPHARTHACVPARLASRHLLAQQHACSPFLQLTRYLLRAAAAAAHSGEGGAARAKKPYRPKPKPAGEGEGDEDAGASYRDRAAERRDDAYPDYAGAHARVACTTRRSARPPACRG